MLSCIPPARPLVALLSAVAFSSGCSGRDVATSDSPADTAAALAAIANRMAAADSTAPQDADHEFLRAMSDHHQGLIDIASSAMTRASSPQTQTDAHNLHVQREAERKEMQRLMRERYRDPYKPAVMPSHQAMNDSLRARSGLAYDRAFYASVIRLHRDGIAMIDRYLPRLATRGVRQMAERMRTDQQKDIEELERKLNAIAT